MMKSNRMAGLLMTAGFLMLIVILISFSRSLILSSRVQRMVLRIEGEKSSVPTSPNKNGITSSQSNSALPADAACFDPYRGPGYLFIPSEGSYKTTRWIPFTKKLFDAPDPPYASYPPPGNSDVYFHRGDVEPEFVPAMPSLYSAILAEHNRRRSLVGQSHDDFRSADFFIAERNGGGLGWLWGRRVLTIGDSVDRFMVQFFCEEFSNKMFEPERHTTATCHIPTFNLTLAVWHFPGSYTSRPKWWWMKDMKYVQFEERWDKIWESSLKTDVRGANGKSPDLVLWQNGLWDQRLIWEAGGFHDGNDKKSLGSRERQLVWEEVRFILARLKKLLNKVQQEFGLEVPMMYRAVTTHRESNAKDANLYEIDRIGRFIANQFSMEIFEWGRILTSFSMLYQDQTHLGKGPASWIWGEMMLGYLKRSSEGKWSDCHQEYLGWGGR